MNDLNKGIEKICCSCLRQNYCQYWQLRTTYKCPDIINYLEGKKQKKTIEYDTGDRW